MSLTLLIDMRQTAYILLTLPPLETGALALRSSLSLSLPHLTICVDSGGRR